MACLFLRHILDRFVVWHLAQLRSSVPRANGLFSRITGTNRWVDRFPSSLVFFVGRRLALRHRKVKRTLVIEQESQLKKMIYYMPSSLSGQDEPNLALATRVGYPIERARWSNNLYLLPLQGFCFFVCNEQSILDLTKVGTHNGLG